MNIQERISEIDKHLDVLQKECQEVEDIQIEEMKRAIDANPGDFDAKLELADLYARQAGFSDKAECYEDAIEMYKALITVSPKNHKLYLKLGDLYLNRGAHTGNEDLYPLVFANYSRALELSPDDKEAYIKMGIFYVIKRVYSKAIDMLMRVIEMDTDLPVYYYLGNVYFARKWFDEAIEAYNASKKCKHPLVDAGLVESQIENAKKKSDFTNKKMN